MRESDGKRNPVRRTDASKVSTDFSPKVRRAVLFVNLSKKNARKLGGEIAAEFASRNIEAETFFLNSSFKPDSIKACDIAVSLGGDGTVLSAARIMAPLGVPVFPVNLGTFGFIAGVKPEEWREVLAEWLRGKAPVSRRLMLEIGVERGGRKVLSACCLNDVVISSSGIAKIINLQVSYSDPGNSEPLKLGRYRSDGLIVSTPTGSTAYSVAAGGPIVDPELDALIVNPICPFTLSIRPMVLPADETVIVEVEKEQRSGVILTVDGQITEKLKKGDRVFLKKAPYYCRLAASGRKGFYETLRTKFAWRTGGGSHD